MNKRNHNPWVAKVEMDTGEPVSHDQVEPNDTIDAEIEFDVGDIADYAAYNYRLKPNKEIADAIYDFLDNLPCDVQAEIADCLREDEGFKQWLSERKDADLDWYRQLQARGR